MDPIIKLVESSIHLIPKRHYFSLNSVKLCVEPRVYSLKLSIHSLELGVRRFSDIEIL